MLSSVSVGMVVAGRYTLQRCVSRGGLGSLWIARDEQSDLICSLRLAERTGQGVVELATRYLAEADIVGRIRCENVVDVLDYGDWNGIPFLVLEHIEGEDLATRLANKGALQPKTAYRIIAQSARALARAHAVGIVHGDLSPEHILITSDGMQPMAKVFNFAVAQRTPGSANTNATRVGSFLRMPYYSSPEQIVNQPIDWRADLWSLAVIGYECLVGSKPFDTNSFGELVAQVASDPVPPIALRGTTTPPRLTAWWRKALSPKIAERFQSAKELADELGNALGFPLVFVPESTSSSQSQQLPPVMPIALRDSGAPPNTGRTITPNPHLRSSSNPSSRPPSSASGRPSSRGMISGPPGPISSRRGAEMGFGSGRDMGVDRVHHNVASKTLVGLSSEVIQAEVQAAQAAHVNATAPIPVVPNSEEDKDTLIFSSAPATIETPSVEPPSDSEFAAAEAPTLARKPPAVVAVEPERHRVGTRHRGAWIAVIVAMAAMAVGAVGFLYFGGKWVMPGKSPEVLPSTATAASPKPVESSPAQEPAARAEDMAQEPPRPADVASAEASAQPVSDASAQLKQPAHGVKPVPVPVIIRPAPATKVVEDNPAPVAAPTVGVEQPAPVQAPPVQEAPEKPKPSREGDYGI